MMALVTAALRDYGRNGKSCIPGLKWLDCGSSGVPWGHVGERLGHERVPTTHCIVRIEPPCLQPIQLKLEEFMGVI